MNQHNKLIIPMPCLRLQMKIIKNNYIRCMNNCDSVDTSVFKVHTIIFFAVIFNKLAEMKQFSISFVGNLRSLFAVNL